MDTFCQVKTAEKPGNAGQFGDHKHKLRLKLVELGECSYVVQLDADTITLGPLDEAWQCIHRGTGFTLTSEIDARIIPTGEAAANAQLRDTRHFQIAAEAQLDKLDPAMAANYVR